MGEYLMEGTIEDLPVAVIKPSKTIYRHIDDTKVKQLADSIAKFGLRHPITVSEDNVIISGNHRLAAVKSLGKKTIRAEVIPVDELLAKILMLEENLFRAELTILEQSEHLAEHTRLLDQLGQKAQSGKHVSKKGDSEDGDGVRDSAPVKTTKDIAEDMGFAERTLQERLQIANAIDAGARAKIRGTPISDNKTELIRLAKLGNAEEQNFVVDSVLDGTYKNVKDAVATLLIEKQKKEFDTVAADMKDLPDTILLNNKDFFDAEGDDDFIKHNTIDIIVTNLPHNEEWSENIVPFMNISADILKPGGYLVAYVSQDQLPEVFDAIRCTQTASADKISRNNKLEYLWLGVIEHRDTITAIHPRGIQCGITPVIIAYKPPMQKPYKYFDDIITGTGKSKASEDSTKEMVKIFDSFSKPGSVCLDPFIGKGFVGVAAKMTARKFIGYSPVKAEINALAKKLTE
jgi:ParB-like chromosome segregation protein Spo0J